MARSKGKLNIDSIERIEVISDAQAETTIGGRFQASVLRNGQLQSRGVFGESGNGGNAEISVEAGDIVFVSNLEPGSGPG